jgi:hypothetical protein
MKSLLIFLKEILSVSPAGYYVQIVQSTAEFVTDVFPSMTTTACFLTNV